MKRIRKKRIKAVCVITAIVLVPSIIMYLTATSSAFNYITKQATLICAKLTIWNKDASAPLALADKEMPVNQIIVDETNASRMVSQGTLWELDMAPEEIETLPDNTEVVVPQEKNPLPYPTSIENKSGVISQYTFSAYSGAQYINLQGAGQVRNCTSVTNSLLISESKKLPDFKIVQGEEPQVLIMHTHTTESYEPYSRQFYDSSFNSRTTDNTKNVVAVGNKIEQELKAAGIGVIHDTTLYDYPVWNGSYTRSGEGVKNILKKYPSIKVVLDVHRDAIQGTDGVRTAPVANINGKSAAQVMIISGCDDGTMNMPNYMKNFRLASLLQSQMEGDYPGLTRPVLFDYRKYNQDLTTGSLLLEMGAHGNSVDEALYSGELVGKSLAKALKKCK